MRDLQDAFLELVKEITENLAGAFNLGLNSADEFHDRLDFLLIYVMLGFSANYGSREFSMYEAIHNEYIRKLAEKEQAIEFEDSDQLVITKKEDEPFTAEVDADEAGEEGIVQASLDESEAAEAAAIIQVVKVLTALSIATVSSGGGSTATASDNEEIDTPTATSSSLVQQIVSIIENLLNNVPLNEDSTTTTLNVFTEADAMGLDTTSMEFVDAFDSLFNGATSLMPTFCDITSIEFYGEDTATNSKGDIVINTTANAQALDETQIGEEATSFVFPGLTGIVARATLKVTGVNDAPTLPADVAIASTDSDGTTVFDLETDLLAKSTDPDGGDTTTILSVVVNNVVVPAGSSSNGVTVTATQIIFDPTFFASRGAGGPTAVIPVKVNVTDGTDTSEFTINYTVVPQNQDPTSADFTRTEDPAAIFSDPTSYVFQLSDFTFDDVDSGDSLEAISITSLPATGQLILNGTPIVAGSLPVLVTPADISAGNLIHQSAAAESGTTTFNFRVIDDLTNMTSSGLQTATINVDNRIPFIDWNFLGSTLTELPRFLVDEFTFDDPIDNALIGGGGVVGAVELDQYIQDAENDGFTFTLTSPLPGWLTQASSGVNTGNLLQETPGSRALTPFLSPGILTTVSYQISDNSPLPNTFMPPAIEFFQFRLDFDVTGGVNNAPLGTVTDNEFAPIPTTGVTRGPSESPVYLLNAGGTTLMRLSEIMDWSIVTTLGSPNFQITVTDPLPGGTGASSSVIFEDIAASSVISPTAGDFITLFDVRIGNTALTAGDLFDGTTTTLYRTALGTNGDDGTGASPIIAASLGATVLFGLDGDDILHGDTEDNTAGFVGGDQFISAGPGSDAMTGDIFGNLLGTAGDDVLMAGDDDDTVYGDTGSQALASATLGSDRIYGGAGLDTLIGDAASSIFSSGGDDFIFGDDGNDDITGDGGTFVLSTVANGGDDTIDGGLGSDTIYGDSSQDLTGTGGDDVINGGENAAGDLGDFIYGDARTMSLVASQGGDDMIFGDEGGDRLVGDSQIGLAGTGGDDTIEGGLGDDLIFGDAFSGDLSGVGGNDTLRGGGGVDIIRGDVSITLSGVAGDDIIEGGAGNDDLAADTTAGIYGTKGKDFLFGGEGDDTIRGGANAGLLKSAGAFEQSNRFNYDLSIDNGDDDVGSFITNNSAAALNTSPAIFSFENIPVLRGVGETAFDLFSLISFSVVGGTFGTYVASFDDADATGTDSTITFGIFGVSPLTSVGAGRNTLLNVSLDETVDNPSPAVSNSTQTQFTIGLARADTVYTELTVADVITDNSFTTTVVNPTIDVIYLTGTFSDTLAGDAGGPLLAGTLTTPGASQNFNGGPGNDQLYGDARLDVDNDGANNGTSANDIISGGAGNDNIYGDAGRDILETDGGDDILIGGPGVDFIWGDAGRDIIISGNAGNDIIYGGEDNDTLVGDAGTSVVGNKGSDIFVYNIASDFINAQDTISDFDFTNDGAIGDDTIELINTSGTSLGYLTEAITVKNTAAGADHFIDFGTPSGAAVPDTATITGSGIAAGTREYTFSLVDTTGSSSNYSVIAGEANGANRIVDTSVAPTMDDILLIDTLSANGAITNTVYSFTFGAAASTVTKAISFFDSANGQNLEIDLPSIAVPTMNAALQDSLTDVIDSGFDVDQNGTNDAALVVRNTAAGPQVGQIILGEFDFQAGADDLSDAAYGGILVTIT